MSHPDLPRIAASLAPSSFPRKLAVEVCAACNLACTMCHHPAMRRPKGVMPFELFRKCADEVAAQAPDTECWFSFCGEPLLEPEALLRMIEYGKQVGLGSLNVNSNGMLLTPELTDRLVDSGVDLIVFGVDGFSKATYERIRAGGERDVLYENIRRLLRVRQARNTGPDVQVQFIEMDENVHELEAFKQYWLDQGAVVKVRNKLSWGGTFETPMQEPWEERIPCPWAVTMMHVFWDGRVPRCPGDTEGDEGVGNAWDESLQTLWGRLGTYREHHLERRFDLLPERCGTCKDWMVGSANRIRPAADVGCRKTLYLCGAGNPEGVRLAQQVNRATNRWERVVLLDDDASKHARRILGVEIAGSFDALATVDADASEIVNLVARTTRNRTQAATRIGAHGLPAASLVDPGVDTSGAELGPETTVYEHATVCPGSVVGEGSVVFMSAIVGHGALVGRGCVIGPGAVLNARVELADGVYVGSNATVLPEVRIGAWATIGAGSVVVQDVPPGATVFGVPAQALPTGAGLGEGADVESSQAARDEAPPPVELEAAISLVWREVLGLADVDPNVNLFDLGGDSLRALQVCARLRERIARDLAVTDLFRFPTVRSLAQHVHRSTGGGAHEHLRAHEDRGARRRRAMLARRHLDT
ncbi:MAG: phosphopantetheine-binding protein [Planctomycetota bacterium]